MHDGRQGAFVQPALSRLLSETCLHARVTTGRRAGPICAADATQSALACAVHTVRHSTRSAACHTIIINEKLSNTKRNYCARRGVIRLKCPIELCSTTAHSLVSPGLARWGGRRPRREARAKRNWQRDRCILPAVHDPVLVDRHVDGIVQVRVDARQQGRRPVARRASLKLINTAPRCAPCALAAIQLQKGKLCPVFRLTDHARFFLS